MSMQLARPFVFILFFVFCFSWNRYTNYNDYGEGDVVFLDRHKVECSSNELLQGWRLENSGNNYHIGYDCLYSQSVMANDYYTEWTSVQNASDNKSSASRRVSGGKLSNHYIKCRDNYALRSWWVETVGGCSSNMICSIKIGYQCTRVKLISGCSYSTSSLAGWNQNTYNIENSPIYISGYNVLQGFQMRNNGGTYYFDYWYCPVRNLEQEINAYNTAVNKDIDYTPSWAN
jgi:hypothetical protein